MSLPQAIQDYINGNKLTPEQIEKRKSICFECPKMKEEVGFKKSFPFIGWQKVCSVCGCYLTGPLGKLSAPKETCPDLKW
jgi:hypothetical protein